MSLTTRPFAHLKELDKIGVSDVNVSGYERIGSVIGGLAILGAIAIRRSPILTPIMTILGSALIYRGATGQCPAYKALSRDTSEKKQRGVPGETGKRVEQSIEVKRPVPEVYRYWRSFSNLPMFMPHLRSVQETDDGISHWIVEGPLGTEVEWDAEIVNETANEVIAWQTLPGASIRSAGTVRFESVNAESLTRITVTLKYALPAKALGAMVARIFGEFPERQLTEDLRRFKQLLEADQEISA